MGNNTTKLNFSKYEKFFDEHGFTMTSAEKLADKLKEHMKAIMPARLSFIDVTSTSCNSAVVLATAHGATSEELKALKDALKLSIEFRALISYLREAIKAKDAQMNAVEYTAFQDWMKENYPDVDLRTFNADIVDVERPEMPSFDIKDYVRDNMSVKDVAEYLYLQSACTEIGEFIHPGGKFAEARERAYQLDGTSKVENHTANTLVSENKLSVPKDEIESVFFDLQEQHREYQKHLNKILFGIQNDLQTMQDEYEKKMHEYRCIQGENELKISTEENVYQKEFNAWRISERAKIRAKKIVIPNAMKKTADYINKNIVLGDATLIE